MPKFKNVSEHNITVIVKGRKILVKSYQEIEGPEYLSMYSNLVRMSEVQPKGKKSNRPVIQEKKVKPVVAKYEPFKREPINIKTKVDAKISFDKIKTVEDTKNYISQYPKNKLPSVAICILSKNAFDFIRDCIKSILSHVKYENFKIYVFDTGTDDQRVIKFYESMKEKIEVISIGSFNFSKNYNDGIKKLSEDFIVIQNNDTKAINDYVSKLLKITCLQKTGIVGPRMIYKDGRIQHDGQTLYNHGLKKFINPGHLNIGKNSSQVAEEVLRVDGITGAGIFIKRKLFIDLGGFSEKYLDIYQDVDLNIQVRMNGYNIFCDTSAKIYHYDNSSRKEMWKQNPQETKKMWMDSSYLSKRINNKELIYYPNLKYKFSIITLVNNEATYNDFLNDLKVQEDCPSFELIAIPNFNGEYNGCSEPLNVGLDTASSHYSIICHQDLRLPKNWLRKLYTKLIEMENEKWGVIGMAGAYYFNNKRGGVTFLNNASYIQHTNIIQEEVQCLDELCLIVRTDYPIRFDESRMKGFHFYGADLCLQYISKGFKNYAINVPCNHLSDGFGNLMKKEQQKNFITASKKLNSKWGYNIKRFRTMTTEFDNNNNYIRYFIADRLEGFPKQENTS